jgi:septal ring-binding cell division protein DamX
LQKAELAMKSGKLVALEGASGVGKTALLEEILTLYFEDANKSYVTITEGLSPVQIRSRIIEQLFGNVLFDPELPLLTSFIELSGPSEMLLVIDNVHFLSGQVIGELLQLVSESTNLGMTLRVVISFNKTISSTLLNVKSELVQVFQIPMLDKSESYQFLQQYFSTLPPESDSGVKRWIDLSAGHPTQLLSYGKTDVEDNENVKPLNLTLWITVLITASLVLALGMYSYRKLVNLEPQSEQSPITADLNRDSSQIQVVKPWKESVDGQKTKVQLVASAPTVFKSLTGELVSSLPPQDETAPELILGELTGNLEQAKSAEINPEKSAGEVLADSKQFEEQVKDSANKADVLASLEEANSQEVNTELPTAEKQKVDETLNESAVKSNDIKLSTQPDSEDMTASENEGDSISLDFFEQELTPKTSAELMAEQQIPLEQGIVSNENEGQPIVIPNQRYVIDNQAFLSLPRDKFSLQVTAVSSQEVLAEYLESAPLPAEAFKIYQVKRNNKDWIVVTYGIFDTIEDARAEATRILPKAWAKSIAVIQQQILAHQKNQKE